MAAHDTSQWHEERHVDIGSSTIKDTFELKRLVNLRTTSGSIKARIAVAPSSASHRTLFVGSTSGSVDVDFLTALGPTAQCLNATITCTSGSIKAVIPDDFAGTVKISTTSGSSKVKGDGSHGLGGSGVTVLRNVMEKDPETGRDRKVMIGVRGVERPGEGSELLVQATSGSIKIKFERRSKDGWMNTAPDPSSRSIPPPPPPFDGDDDKPEEDMTSDERAAAEKRRLAKAEEAWAERGRAAGDAPPPSYEESESSGPTANYRWNTGIDHQ